MFDPEKVERPFVKEWGHHAVYMSDYDHLLRLYRTEQARAKVSEDFIKKEHSTPSPF